MYRIGQHRVTLFGGYDVWEIVSPQDEVIAHITGPREQAETLLTHLNREL